MADDAVDKELYRIRNELIVKGEFEKALDRLKGIEQQYPSNINISSLIRETTGYKKDEELISRYIDRQSYKMACDRLRKLTKTASECSRLRILKCECMLYTDKLADALLAYPKIKETDDGAKYIHSLMYYYKGDLDKAISYCEKLKTPKAEKFLIDLKELKTSMELGQEEEKKKDFRKALNHYCKVIEYCDDRTNGYCLNKIIIAKALVRRAWVNAVLHAYIDSLSDSHRTVDMLKKLEADKFEMDKKLKAYLWAHSFISLAIGNAKLKVPGLPVEFDFAYEYGKGYKDIENEIHNAISYYEATHKLFYIGKAENHDFFESIIPNEVLLKHSLQELKTSALNQALLNLTKLPIESDDKEVDRVVECICSRCRNKFKTASYADLAKELLKRLEAINLPEGLKILIERYNALEKMSLIERCQYLDIKPSSAKDDNDKWRQSKLRLFAGKNFHPDHFHDIKEKNEAGKILALLMS